MQVNTEADLRFRFAGVHIRYAHFIGIRHCWTRLTIAKWYTSHPRITILHPSGMNSRMIAVIVTKWDEQTPSISNVKIAAKRQNIVTTSQ